MASIGDLVLVYREDRPAFFARIEDISANHKPDWYQVRLLVLQLPVIETLWILREEYINGESFTMGGHKIRIEKIKGPVASEEKSTQPGGGSREKDASGSGKVIPLFKRKKGVD